MPAAVMTYDTLAASIPNYSERANDASLIAQIPELVMLAENELAADLKVLGTEIVVESTMTAGEPVIEKPTYWRQTVSLTVTVPGRGRVTLHKRVYEYLRNFWPDDTITDVPRFYAEYNINNFLIAPTPAAAYTFELVYNARLDPLSADNQTNWLTANAPQLLLYCSMYHASLFLKNFDKAAEWRGRYDAGLAAFRMEDGMRVMDRSTMET
jgi:hypothetical protein